MIVESSGPTNSIGFKHSVKQSTIFDLKLNQIIGCWAKVEEVGRSSGSSNLLVLVDFLGSKSDHFILYLLLVIELGKLAARLGTLH